TSRHEFNPEPERTLKKKLRARKFALYQVSTLKQKGRSQQQWETSHQRVTMRGYFKRIDNNQISSKWWEDESNEHYDKPQQRRRRRNNTRDKSSRTEELMDEEPPNIMQ
ncbi:hypothetical protein A2U01_0044048, partial [Trifolium medium]|nr:hypothetical protein [Trifolium medium]